MPLNRANIHWCLLVINYDGNLLEIYDSMPPDEVWAEEFLNVK